VITAKDILERGYFPKELPPLFSTRSLAAHWAELPLADPKQTSYCLRCSYSKYATIGRTLSIPNPAQFLPLAVVIESNWPDLEAHCVASPIAKTQPKIDRDRAITWSTPLTEIPLLRAQQRVGARYVLQADVAACYASIYTHAIPWALHTKGVAKQDRNSTRSPTGGPPLAGNVIDLHSRNIQSGQTMGIPVGPDTSVVIAEAVLTAVDKIVANKIGATIRAFRFVDDYEFVCETLPEAEKARNVLQEALGEFELQLNPRKTRILELPNVLDTPWVNELSAFQIESRKLPALQSQLIRYFSRAFEIARDNPGEPVLKYAVGRLSKVDTTPAAKLAQHLLFQAACIDPATLQTALYVAFKHGEQGISPARNAMERALTAIICNHSLLQHGGDIAWALWGAVVFHVKLEEKAIQSLEKLTDPIAILMALFADSKGAFARRITLTQWEQFATAAELFDRRWLVGYESIGHAWLTVTADPARSDPFFDECRKRGIHFMDVNHSRVIPAPAKVVAYD
jgi:hypothetical protein